MRKMFSNITNSDFCLKCSGCCVFSEDEKVLSPYFSKKEASFIDKNKLEKRDSLRQAKVFKVRKGAEDFYKCAFFELSSHKCKIYNKRPIDCVIWPFVVGWDKKGKDVYIWIVNKDICPLALSINTIKRKKVIDDLVDFLSSTRFFEEIRNKERKIWPYFNYHVKIKKITNLINK